MSSTTLAIDFGSRYIGIALVSHPLCRQNRVLYAATLVVGARPLKSLVKTRARTRSLRRTRKTHRRRLLRLAQALHGIPGADAIVRFCRRRGYCYEGTQSEAVSLIFSRATFFSALREEVTRVIAGDQRNFVLTVCRRHLNESRRREAELRPARFQNRRPSRCRWELCSANVPRAKNDVLGRIRQAVFKWMLPVFDESPEPKNLRHGVERWTARLASVAGKTDAASRKVVRRTFRCLLDHVRREAPHGVAEKFLCNWKKTYRRAIRAILRGRGKGRVRFCRKHSEEFISHLLENKRPPCREEVSEGDLSSRQQQIVFRRLWRFVGARLLPLAGGRIDRVVVERVAFDVLAGSLNARRKVPQERASAMYWHGPHHGFRSTLEMLKAEFGGLCAYCGHRMGAAQQVEHILPRSAFPFDSYFNVLPACFSCNARKGARTPMEAGMVVCDDAYRAYSEYVENRKVPHVYHTVKKGLLNLLRRVSTVGEAERRVAMLANDLVNVTTSQRSPRPLARYLATKLGAATGHRPEIAYRAGRHTALYRAVMMPHYCKRSQELRNHAVDAIILGCDLPSASLLENTNCDLPASFVSMWFEAVRLAAPEALDGLPLVEPVKFVPYFEEDLGGGYCKIDLHSFNWNRERRATHQLEPFGQTGDGRPLKRIPASTVLTDLLTPASRSRRISLIANRGLRQVLEKDPGHAPERFIRWLQQSVQVVPEGDHPADRARRALLQRFLQAPVEPVLAGEEPIPFTIGIRCLHTGARSMLDVVRVDQQGKPFQRHMAYPVVRELYVGYGSAGPAKPVLFFVNQVFGVRKKTNKGRVPVNAPAESPLHGRPHGSTEPFKQFLAGWRAALVRLFEHEGLVLWFRVTQGCVIEKDDGTRFQFRNFEKPAPWMKAGSFRNIKRVYRSPLQAIASERPDK